MTIDQAYSHLIESVEFEVTLYRTMLDIVRREHEILVASKMDDLIENNQAKDALVSKIRSNDRIREKRVKEISVLLQIKSEPVRLLEIASHLNQVQGDRLRSIHTTLDLLVKRIREHNEKNEALIQSALRTIQGALENLKTSLEGQKTYQSEGNVDKAPITTGRFVSREA